MQSRVLVMELVVESTHLFHGSAHLFGWAHKVSKSKMVGTVLLAKSAAWYSHNACFLEQIHAVHEVWKDMEIISSLDSLVRKSDLREAIHGALDLVASNVGHASERVLKNVCSINKS